MVVVAVDVAVVVGEGRPFGVAGGTHRARRVGVGSLAATGTATGTAIASLKDSATGRTAIRRHRQTRSFVRQG